MVNFSNILVVNGINNNVCTINATKYRTKSILESEFKVNQECLEEEETHNDVESFDRFLMQLKSDAMSLIEMLHLIAHFPRTRS